MTESQWQAKQEVIENQVNAMEARQMRTTATKTNCEAGKACDKCCNCLWQEKAETPSVLHIGEIDWQEVKSLLKREPIS